MQVAHSQMGQRVGSKACLLAGTSQFPMPGAEHSCAETGKRTLWPQKTGARGLTHLRSRMPKERTDLLSPSTPRTGTGSWLTDIGDVELVAEKFLNCGRPTQHPTKGGKMGWLRDHRDLWICGQRRGRLGTQEGCTHWVQITAGVV